MLIYPACWTVQSLLLAGELLPTIGWWLLAPLSGVSSLLFRERHAQLLDELRTYLRLNSHAEMKQELGQRLERVPGSGRTAGGRARRHIAPRGAGGDRPRVTPRR